MKIQRLFIFALTLVLLTTLAPAQTCNNTFGVLFGSGAPAASQCTASTNGLEYVQTGSPGGHYFCQCTSGTSAWILINTTVSDTTPPAGSTITGACPENSAGTGLTVPVQWVLTSPNTYAITLCYDSTSASTPLISLVGTSLQPVLTCSPLSLTFPATNTNQSSPPQSVACTNTSTNGATATFTGVTFTTGTNYSQTNNCGVLSPNQACSVNVTFTPTTTGTLTDTLNIASNASGSPTTVSLTGTGQTPTIPTPSSLALSPANPSFAVGTFCPTETATLTMSDNSTRNLQGGYGNLYWNTSSSSVLGITQGSNCLTPNAAGTATLSADAGGPITSPQRVDASNNTSGVTSLVTPALSNATIVGDTVLCWTGWNDATAAAPAVTDTAGDTFTEDTSSLEQANSLSSVWFYSLGVKAQANETFTATWGGGGANKPELACFELEPASAVDTQGVATAASGTAVSVSATTTQANDLIFLGTATSSAVKKGGEEAGSYCLLSGQSGEDDITGTNLCPASAMGNGVSWMGLFASGATPITTTLLSSGAWAASAIALKVVSASTTVTVTNAPTIYSLSSPPSSTYKIYPAGTGGNGQNSIYDTVLTGDCFDGNCTSGGGILAHCQGNTSNCSAGDAIAKFAVTGNSGCNGNPEVCGFFQIAPAGTSGASNSSSDTGCPLYYGTATSPWYSLTANGLNLDAQLPSGATFGGSTSDQWICLWDQANQVMVEGEVTNKGAGYSLPTSTCTTGPACAVSLNGKFTYATAARPGTDANFNNSQAYNVTSPGLYTLGGSDNVNGLGIQAMATVVRFKELSAGTINHAIQMSTNCGLPNSGTPNASAFVYPATSGLKPCSATATNEPSAGMLLVCDYTSAQITAMSLDPANAAMITACSKYGWYFSQTRGPTSGASFTGFGMPGTGGWESNEAYVSTNTTNSDLSTISSNNPNWLTCANIGTSKASCSGYVFKGIGRLVGPEGTDAEGNSCTVSPGCLPSGHVHVIDSCVVKTLDNVSGGCP